MPRKRLLLLVLAIFVIFSLPAKLVVNYYSDTREPFISQDKPQDGTFSNTWAKDADLKWYVVVTDTDVSFVVYYYGTLRAERTSSSFLPVYLVTAVDDQGVSHSFNGRLYSDRIMLDEDDAFRALMSQSVYLDLTLAVKSGENLSYSFSSLDCEDFSSLYVSVYGSGPAPRAEEEAPAAKLKLAPRLSLGLSMGLVLPFSEDNLEFSYMDDCWNLRGGVSVIFYALRGKHSNLGFRADASAFTATSENVYELLDGSLSLYYSHYSRLSESLCLSLEIGAGLGLLHSKEVWGNDTAALLRVPVAAAAAGDHWQLALECFLDISAVYDDWDTLGYSLSPAVSLRFAF